MIQFFQDVLTRKGSDAPLPEHLKEQGPELDDNYDNEGKISTASSFRGTVIFMQYSDAKGEISKRRVRIESIDEVYLKGFCFYRNEKRTFKIDGIQSIVDMNSGEVSDNPRSYLGVIRSVGAFADGASSKSQIKRKKEKFLDESDKSNVDSQAHFIELVATIAAEIRLLVFIARADSKLSSKEMKLLRKYVEARSEDLSLPITRDQTDQFEYWIKSQFPDEKLLLQSTYSISAFGDQAVNSLLDMAELLVGIDGKITETERKAYSDLALALRTSTLPSSLEL